MQDTRVRVLTARRRLESARRGCLAGHLGRRHWPAKEFVMRYAVEIFDYI